jgi:hypothetical protein
LRVGLDECLPPSDSKLQEDVVDMLLDRPRAQLKFERNFLVGKALSYQQSDRALARAQNARPSIRRDPGHNHFVHER